MKRLVFAKVGKDASWTVIIVLVLSAGLTAWIIIPSISGSLEGGLENYANNTSTFIIIQNTAGPNQGGNDSYLQGLIPQIAGLPGVQSVYPIRMEYTWRLSKSPICLQSGCVNATGVTGFSSAVIGGRNGFPFTLVTLVRGHLPGEDEPAFILNAPQLKNAVDLNGSNQLKIGDSNWNSTTGVKFNATVAGVTALNPLTSGVQVLWNATFLQHKLGSQLYDSTFAGYPNFMVIKADNIGSVESIANSVTKMLKADPNFFVNYDQSTLLALKSLQSQSLPLYALLQGSSLTATVAIVFLVSYLNASRRRWEAGLLLTQGWTWARYLRFMLSYYSLVALAASALSVALSLIIEGFLTYQYVVFGNVLTITTSLDPLYLASAIPLALGISGAAALASTSKMKRLGLDSILREY